MSITLLYAYLYLDATLVSPAGEVDDEGPIIRMHLNPSSLCTCCMKGSGAAPMRALHAATCPPFHPLATILTFLQKKLWFKKHRNLNLNKLVETIHEIKQVELPRIKNQF